jgi:hypothetical protein
LWPTWAIFGVVALFHSLTIVSARFRIPIEPLSFVWAAGAVAPLVDRLVIQPWEDWRSRASEKQDDGEAAPPHPILQGPHRRPHVVRPAAIATKTSRWRRQPPR